MLFRAPNDDSRVVTGHLRFLGFARIPRRQVDRMGRTTGMAIVMTRREAESRGTMWMGSSIEWQSNVDGINATEYIARKRQYGLAYRQGRSSVS